MQVITKPSKDIQALQIRTDVKTTNILKIIPLLLHSLNQVDRLHPCCSSSEDHKKLTYQFVQTYSQIKLRVQQIYLWEFVETWQVFFWIVLPVFPVIEINTQPVTLKEDSQNDKPLLERYILPDHNADQYLMLVIT